MITSFTILQQGSTYTFLWQPAAAQETAGAAAYACWAGTRLLPHQQRELQAAIDSAAQAAGQLRQASGDSLQALLRLGRLLFSHLLPPALQEMIRRLPPGSPLCICTNDTELPWELLHDDQEFLALRHLVARQLLTASGGNTHAGPPAESLNCLLIGNPNGDLLAADAEVEDLLDLMETAPQAVRAEFLCREHATKVRVLSALASGEYELIHFACHARPGALQLADGWLESTEIQAVLRGRPLVVLNACSSSRARAELADVQTRDDLPFAAQQVHSLAQAFLIGGAPIFLGAAWPVDDVEIRRLAVEFYRALLGGHTLGSSLRHARLHSQRRAAQARQPAVWAAPVLYGDPLYRLLQPPVHRQLGTILSVRIAVRQEFSGEESLETYTRRAQQLANQLLAAARSFGGEVITIRPDALHVLFGVPHPVEDDAIRAIRTALEIRPLLERSAGSSAVAIASGEIATAALQPRSQQAPDISPLLYVGPLFGEAAALLHQSHSGQVLVNERARQLAQGRFVFVPHMAGSEYDTLLCYEVAAGGETNGASAAAASVQHPGAQGQLLGREREVGLLASWWQAARQGYGQVVGIVGEAGVGKTRLLQEFRCTLDPQDHTWIGLACSSTGRDTPYSLVAQLLRWIFDILPGDNDQAAAAKIEQGLAKLPGSLHAADLQLNQILRETLGLSTSNVAEDERKARRGRLVNLLRTMMANVAREQPLIIAIDDLHWVDDASLELLGQVTDGIHRLRMQFVILYRPEWQHGWFDKAYYRHLPLDQLDQAASLDLLRVLLGGAELPKGLAVLLQKTGGNPFFIEEMVKSLQENGILVRRAGDWAGQTAGAATWELPRPLTEQQLPGTVERTLRVRLASLTSSTRTVLETAAVIGPQFGLPLLQQLLADTLEGTALDAALAELERRGFVEASWDVQEYRFRHALILDAVGQTLSPAQHQAWRRRIAEALEAQGAEVETLAHHLYHSLLASRPAEPPRVEASSNAAQVEKAVACLLQCGQRSLLRNAAPAAITYYQRVLLLAPLLPARDDAEVTSREGIGDALTLLGSFDAAYEELRRAYAALHMRPLCPVARRRAADLTRRIGRACAWRGKHEEALAWMAEGLRMLGEPQDDEDRAVAALLHVHKGSVEYNRGNLEEVAHDCERGLVLARAVGRLLPAEAEAHNMLGIIAWAGGHIPEALAHYAQSRAGWLALGNSYQVARVEGNMGVAYFYQAQWEQARLHHARCKEYWEQIEDRDMLAHPCLNLGNIYLYQGDWMQAEIHFRQALALWNSAHHERFMALGHTNLGLLYIEQEEWVKAQAQLEESYALLTGAKIRDLLCEVLAALAEVALGTGDLSRADELASLARRQAAELGMQHEEALALRIRGRIRLAQADLNAARANLETALGIFQATANQYEAARTRRHLAQVESAAGCFAAAAGEIETALAVFNSLGANHDRVLAERLQGQLTQRRP